MRAGEQQGPSDRDGGEGHLDSRQSVSYSLTLSLGEGDSCATRTRTLDKGKAFPCAWPWMGSSMVTIHKS